MIVSGSHRCADTVRHSILIVNDSLIFPNIITPNGDGFNDNFVIKGLEDGAYPVNRFVVYNRWGKKVYDTDNYVNGEFDGKFLAGTDFLEGRFVRDEEVAVDIIKDLAHRGLLQKKEKYEH